jgi:CBS domain-containing protein
MKVKEIMSSNPIRTSVDTSVTDAAKLMDSKNIGSLLVEEGGTLVGIMTERDILKKIVAKGIDPKITPVKNIMESPLITIESEKTVDDANEIMTQNRIRRLPVTNQGNIVGIITLRDVSNSLKYSMGRKILGEKDASHYRSGF